MWGWGHWGKSCAQAIFCHSSQIANHEQLLRHITCRKQKRIVPLRLLFPYEGIKQLICPWTPPHPPFCDFEWWEYSFLVSFPERRFVFGCLLQVSQERLARDHVLRRINLLFNSQSPKSRSFLDRVSEAVMVNFNNDLVISTEIF